jgi:putative ABC transport system permease protein
MFRLVWKNLVYDRVWLMVTLSGIVLALVLIIVQIGLFLGFLDIAANVVANNRADI